VLITFEGIDGCGKTSQARQLAGQLGDRALLLREPGGTELGERLRELLKDPDLDLGPTAELMLFCAARAELVAGVIRPALEAGQTVVCDRFTDSTLAYQGYARGLGAGVVESVNRIATGGLVPDLTFLLEIDPELAAARIDADGEREQTTAGDRFEDEGLEFQRKVAAAYAELAEGDPSRFIRIDAELSQDQVAAEVRAALAASGIADG
jgi:dTMP kinase